MYIYIYIYTYIYIYIVYDIPKHTTSSRTTLPKSRRGTALSRAVGKCCFALATNTITTNSIIVSSMLI